MFMQRIKILEIQISRVFPMKKKLIIERGNKLTVSCKIISMLENGKLLMVF